MKTVTTLTNEQLQFLKLNAFVITDTNSGERYYHSPFFFKDLGYNEFEIVQKNNLPEDVKEFIKSEIAS